MRTSVSEMMLVVAFVAPLACGMAGVAAAESAPVTRDAATAGRTSAAKQTSCSLAIHYPKDFNAISEYADGRMEPQFGHFELDRGEGGSIRFIARYDFRQEVPGPNRIEKPGMDLSSEGAYERYGPEDFVIPAHPIMQKLQAHPESRFILIGRHRAYPAHGVDPL